MFKRAYDGKALLSDLLSAGTAGAAGYMGQRADVARSVERANTPEMYRRAAAAMKDANNPANDPAFREYAREFAEYQHEQFKKIIGDRKAAVRGSYGAQGANALSELLAPVGDHHIATPLASIVGRLAATSLLNKVSPLASAPTHAAAAAGGALAARLGLRGYDALTEQNDPTLALKSYS